MTKASFRPILISIVFLLTACTAQSGGTPADNGLTTTLPAPGIETAQTGLTPAIAETPTPGATESPTQTASAPAPTATAVPPSETASAPTATLPASSETATAEPGQVASETTRVSLADSMVQVYVPAGEFLMGSTDPQAKTSEDGGRAYPEIPQHTVSLDEYWIDKYEVTNGQYAICVEAGACQPPYKTSSDTRPSYYGDPEFADYPVIWVKWFMAREYCEWAGRRLPTEAEWEKAARGVDGRKYPWGNDPLTGERANFCDVDCPRTIANAIYDDGYADTAPVGSYPLGASPYGAMDMSGNVWEWTSTIIRPYPYDPDDGRENLNATGAGGERVWRGGPWSNGYWWMRSSVRYRSIADYWYVNLGIRCASSE